MKFTLKKFALLAIIGAFFLGLVGCKDTTTTLPEMTDAEKVQAVIDAIDLGNISAVTEDLTLPKPTTNGVTVTWSSDDVDVIANNGEITVPKFVDGDQEVVLTVTVTLNDATQSKTFTVTVAKETVDTFLNRANTAIIINGADQIKTNFTLPATSLGASVVWTSSNEEMVEIAETAVDGAFAVTVERPKAEDGGVNTTVTLTAVISYGDDSITVTKTIRVIAEPPATVYTSFETMHATATYGEYVDVTGIVYSMFGKGYFIMDDAGKFMAIYTNSTDMTNEVTFGDEVHVKGLYKNYNTLYQVSDIVLQEVLSSDNEYTITPVVLEDAMDLLDLDSANKLIHGQTYTITVTPQLRGTYNNVYLYVGAERAATVYYGSLGASVDALEAVVGKVITVDVVYYTFYTGSSVLEPGVPEVYVTFDGTADDIELAALVGQEALDADKAALDLPAELIGGQSLTLPALGGYNTVITWAVSTNPENGTIANGKLSVIDATEVKTLALTATLTLGELTDTKVFNITVNPIVTSTIADAKAEELGTLVQVEGTVYFFTNNGYYLFDETGMLAIYTPAPAGMLLGDKVKVVGTIAAYKDQFQITNAIVKETISTGNDYTQTPITFTPETTLVSGQTYTVTGTVKVLGTFNNVYLYDGETFLFAVYYRSTINDSYNALKAFADKEVTFNAVFYYVNYDSVPGENVTFMVYQEGLDGISFTPEQQAIENVNDLEVKTSVVSDEVVVLPVVSGDSTVAWALTDSTYGTLVDNTITYANVTAAQTLTLTATFTYPMGEGDPIVLTKDYVVTISTYEEKLAEDKENLTVALTANEFDQVTLSTLGANGTVISWVVTSGAAVYDAGKVTYSYLGVQQSVVLTATLTLTKADTTTLTDTKEFTVVVDPVTPVTDLSTFNEKTEGVWTIENNTYVFVKAVVTGPYGTSGTFLQDALGNGIYAYGLKNLTVGDEVIVYAKLAEYGSVRQLSSGSLKTVLSSGNAVIVTPMTLAELEAAQPAFYEYAGMVVTVTGITIKEFRGDYMDLYWTQVVNGEVTTQYMLSYKYNNPEHAWLSDIYSANDVLPAMQFTFYNIYKTTTFNITNVVIEMTDQQAVDYDKALLPASLELLGDYPAPVGKYAEFGLVSISTELEAYITAGETGLVVTLPADSDVVGSIVVSVTKGLVTEEVTIPVTVKAMTEAQKLAFAAAELPTDLYIRNGFTLDALLYDAVYDSFVVSTELQANLAEVAGVFTATRPVAGSANVVGTVTANISLGSATQAVVINVTVLPYASDLYFSEYMEGSSNNKYYEIFNDTGADVDLSTYSVELFTNGSLTASKFLTLTTTLLNGDVYTVANASAITAIKDIADITSDTTYYNGNDALVLKNGTTVIDCIGQVGFDPVSSWADSGVSTVNMTLVRLASVNGGDTNPADVYLPSVEWVAYPIDTINYIGSHILD